MNTKPCQIFALRALDEMTGEPMPEVTLIAAVQSAFPHLSLTRDDARGVIRALESAGYITGTSDELLGVLWALTPKGTIRVQAL